MVEIKTIRGELTSETAKNILEKYDSNIKIIAVDEIYYPYTLRRYHLKLASSFGRLSKLNRYVDCSIDMVYGRPALAQGSPFFENIYTEEENMLRCNLSDDALNKIGHDFVFNYYLNKSKILRTPQITKKSEEAFYKKFYVVHCADETENKYQILLDALDGSLALL
ncbi:hypothetical protein [Clostridium aminobutyricum]|uniref:Uncharacterized protein n=1 Tax=Clostridium aminobutyricum TaxID=33953 RepID=A0A939DAG7_CLOAM|nr:hypothetical protein [Clostridium aminobutyricum]MBN7774394.1 hypothetical protein [Clostridium aminobutyricum]